MRNFKIIDEKVKIIEEKLTPKRGVNWHKFEKRLRQARINCLALHNRQSVSVANRKRAISLPKVSILEEE